MSYLGNGPTQSLGNYSRDLIQGTNSVGPYTLSQNPGSASAILVFVAGVEQRPTVDYTVSGLSITFTSSVSSSSYINVVYLGNISQTINQTPTPQVTVYTSSSGTYTTPSETLYLTVEMIGGGGGGGGSATSGSGSAGGAGGASTFGSSFLTANGGSGGTVSGGSSSTGGTASGGDFNMTGATGGQAASGISGIAIGGDGGGSFFGAGGTPGYGGNSGITAFAPGAAGGGAGISTGATGGGGGAGGYLRKLITAPLATYSYSVGSAGTAGTAGSGGTAGGAGAAGIIIVTAFFS